MSSFLVRSCFALLRSSTLLADVRPAPIAEFIFDLF